MATLKISDLSVGDWVKIKECAYFPLDKPNDFLSPYAKVTALEDENCIIWLNTQVGEFCASLKNIESIPITAEVLEKNGWLFHKNNRWWVCQIDKDTRANVWLGENGGCRVEVSVMYGESRTWSNYADVKLANAHIHLLQGVLRLAGVDKEIDL